MGKLNDLQNKTDETEYLNRITFSETRENTRKNSEIKPNTMETTSQITSNNLLKEANFENKNEKFTTQGCP